MKFNKIFEIRWVLTQVQREVPKVEFLVSGAKHNRVTTPGRIFDGNPNHFGEYPYCNLPGRSQSPLETSTLFGLLFLRDWLCQLVMWLLKVKYFVNLISIFVFFMYFLEIKYWFPDVDFIFVHVELLLDKKLIRLISEKDSKNSVKMSQFF